ncbi:hypothetical protein AXF42_Ash011882 [Apostasia shenzhenica]|uniref:Iron hydrogenase small subunit domain-containing protein n=1 Tax=Apostasia shenzhenica TaxID=1088818 RepID=A0A2I0AW37_9ASPA|nr:hypothetical protein AXF42_Ash011882 [Apostasia shenzhenica]
MSQKFSPALRSADLNDFIAPSQNCIVSLKGLKAKSDKAENEVKINPLKESLPAEIVKVSLKDCLACSGCITSAETVMLEKQSLEEFLSHIKSGKAVIVSLSPQSRASLASYFALSPVQVFRKLTTFFKSIGVKAVYDTSCSRDISLIESCIEFVSRYRECCTTGNAESGLKLPIISSACPGWICYAEKTLGSFILPYISTVKSPQQVIGSIIKHQVSRKIGFSPDNIFHVTVMPCYDKKLEAARDDFVFSVDHGRNDDNDQGSAMKVPEVDMVLTTGEVLDLIQAKSVDFEALAEDALDRLLTNVDEEGHLYGVSGGSGGYAETIFRYAAKILFDKVIYGPVEFRMIRNSDFREVMLEVEGEVILKFALCYGFRNLRNVVQKISKGKSDYHYLEIMACPSGCLNGGGQIKPKAGQSARSLIQQLETLYTQDVLTASPFDNPIVRSLYEDWLGQPGSEKAKRFMHTQYHPVVKSMASELHNW